MCGHQLPFLSCLIPLYMVKCMCSWRQTLAVWPALVVGGGSFAIFQFVFATIHAYVPGFALWPLTDIGGGIFSMVTLAVFLRFWKPRKEWHFAGGVPTGNDVSRTKARQALIPRLPSRKPKLRSPPGAWSGVVAVRPDGGCLAASASAARWKRTKSGPSTSGHQSSYSEEVPALHEQVERAARLQTSMAEREGNKEEAVSSSPG